MSLLRNVFKVYFSVRYNKSLQVERYFKVHIYSPFKLPTADFFNMFEVVHYLLYFKS